MKDFKELVVWQKSMGFVTEVYRITKSFPKDELYGLVSQLRRAAVSIPANISEGASRSHTSEFVQFLYIAVGSIGELETLLLLSNRLGFVCKEELDKCITDLLEIKRMLRGLVDVLKKKKLSTKRESGFTLVELMLVVVIIAVMVAMVMPRLTGRSEQARKTAAEADINANLSLALDLYEMDNGTYPSTEQGLKALQSKPSTSPAPVNWRGPYIKKQPIDPWGREYRYKSPGAHNSEDYDLSSLGPDGVESEDDVGNWGK